MYSVMGFETDSAEEFASMKTVLWGLVTAIICFINPYIGGGFVLFAFSVYKKRGERQQIEYIKMVLLFLAVPFVILGFMLMLSAFA